MNDAITPFRVDFSEAAIDDLRERLRRTRWPEPATVGGWGQGTLEQPEAFTGEVRAAFRAFR